MLTAENEKTLTPEKALEHLIGYKRIHNYDIDSGVILAIQQALTELSAIKQVVENWDEGEYYTDSIRSMKKIEDIIKGETK